MPEFNPESCEMFISSCDKKYSPQELFNMLIAQDENGCPVLRTNGATAAQITALTTAITNLTAAINAM